MGSALRLQSIEPRARPFFPLSAYMHAERMGPRPRARETNSYRMGPRPLNILSIINMVLLKGDPPAIIIMGVHYPLNYP